MTRRRAETRDSDDVCSRSGFISNAPPPVVETGRAGRFVSGHLLRDLKPAAVLQVGRNAGGAKV